MDVAQLFAYLIGLLDALELRAPLSAAVQALLTVGVALSVLRFLR